MVADLAVASQLENPTQIICCCQIPRLNTNNNCPDWTVPPRVRGAETRRRYLVILVAGCTARRSSGVMRVGERGSGPGVDLQRGTHEDRHQASQYKPGVSCSPGPPGPGGWAAGI